MAIIFKMCLAVCLALLVSNMFFSVEAASMIKREITTENESAAPTKVTTESPVKICDPSLSCGWAVYTAFTREIKYFMKNSCDCPHNEHCIRVDDDPVISAYVYKCRVKRATKPPTTE